LYDVWDGFHLDASRLADVFKGVKLTSLLVLDNTDLGRDQWLLVEGRKRDEDFAEGTLSHTAKENKMKKGNFAIKINGLENPTWHKFCSERDLRRHTWGLQQTAPIVHGRKQSSE